MRVVKLVIRVRPETVTNLRPGDMTEKNQFKDNCLTKHSRPQCRSIAATHLLKAIQLKDTEPLTRI